MMQMVYKLLGLLCRGGFAFYELLHKVNLSLWRRCTSRAGRAAVWRWRLWSALTGQLWACTGRIEAAIPGLWQIAVLGGALLRFCVTVLLTATKIVGGAPLLQCRQIAGVTVRVMDASLKAAFCAQHHVQAAAGCTLISRQQLHITRMLCQH